MNGHVKADDSDHTGAPQRTFGLGAPKRDVYVCRAFYLVVGRRRRRASCAPVRSVSPQTIAHPLTSANTLLFSALTLL